MNAVPHSRHRRYVGVTVLLIPATALALCDSPAGGRRPAADPAKPAAGQVVRQGFPARKVQGRPLECADTAWVIEWDIRRPENNYRPPDQWVPPSSGLWIRSAKFMYKDGCGKVRWVTVLENLLVDALYAQYHDKNGLSDMWGYPQRILAADDDLLGPECVATGKILPSDQKGKGHLIYREVHDDGLRWGGRADPLAVGRGRRGEKLLLWCLVGGGNYSYVTEFGFRDDGVITCRVGATGENYAPFSGEEAANHLHIAGWRWDMILGDPCDPCNGGEAKNRVRLIRRVPSSPRFHYRTEVITFPDDELDPAVEGGAEWVPEGMTTVRFESCVRKNARGQPTAYDVIPLRSGRPTWIPPAADGFDTEGDPAFSTSDFWVTRRQEGRLSPDDSLLLVPELAASQREIDGHATTAWHSSPFFHIPRSEDFGPGGESTRGVALTAWAGFMLRPRNLFDRSPLFDP